MYINYKTINKCHRQLHLMVLEFNYHLFISFSICSWFIVNCYGNIFEPNIFLPFGKDLLNMAWSNIVLKNCFKRIGRFFLICVIYVIKSQFKNRINSRTKSDVELIALENVIYGCFTEIFIYYAQSLKWPLPEAGLYFI